MSGESIFLALGELEEGLVREAALPPRRAARPRRLLPIAAEALLLTALLATASFAFGYAGRVEVPLMRYRTARGDEIVVRPGGNRDFYSSGEETFFVRDGRIYMLLNSEETDVTEACSEETYCAFEDTYEDGTRLLVVAGGTPERMGWFWVYFFPEGDGRSAWQTFMTHCFYDYANAPWAAKAEEDYGLEFMHLTYIPEEGDVDVPTVAELLENGDPVNARGETYGSEGDSEWLGQPDLVLAIGKNGVQGYIRHTEMEEVSGGNVRSPEEALAWNEYVRQRGPVEIPVYKEDGETVVDWFVIGAGVAAEG